MYSFYYAISKGELYWAYPSDEESDITESIYEDLGQFVALLIKSHELFSQLFQLVAEQKQNNTDCRLRSSVLQNQLLIVSTELRELKTS